jgi:hypothetical protein
MSSPRQRRLQAAGFALQVIRSGTSCAVRGRELESFAWSGWVFNTLYLESRHGLMYANFGDAVTSQRLSRRLSDWLVLQAASSQLAVLYCLMPQPSLIADAQDTQRDHRGP